MISQSNIDLISQSITSGSTANKEKFIETQEKEKQYPVNFESWHDVEADQLRFLNKIHRQIEELKSIFSK